MVLKNMFDPSEVQGNKGVIKDLHNDVVEECRKHGAGTILLQPALHATRTQAASGASRFLHGTPRVW